MEAFDYAAARYNMAEQQVRPWDVSDPAVLEVLHDLRREDFVPTAHRHLAYADLFLPIGHGEVALPPRLHGRLLQALALAPHDRVLEIGTGTGLLTAALARLGGHVYSVDCHADFVAAAHAHLRAHGITNVTLSAGNAAAGWAPHAPYDAIAVTGACADEPDAIARQLAVGGRMFVVVGRAPAMHARLVTRFDEHTWIHTTLFETVVPPLQHHAPRPVFHF